jgi:hypothetical protein
MADTTARSRGVPGTPEIVTSSIAADVIIGELMEHRANLERAAHENNTTLLVKRRLRVLDATTRQLTELHGLEA